MESEYLLINSDKDSKGTNWGYPNLNNITKVETETAIEQGLVTGIIIPLNTASITSVRDRWIGSRSKSKSIKSIGSGSRSKLDPFLGHVQ